MGGSSSSSSSGMGQNIYANTSTKNPFVTSTTNIGGTTTKFAPNSALAYVNDYVSKNMGSLIDDYLHPSINSETNQFLLNNYNKNLSKYAAQALNNDIIRPLADRNMIRSSQATNLYGNLSNTLTDKLSDYQATLLENNNQAADKLKTLYDMYMNGYNVVSGNQAQSLNTSSGEGMKFSSGKTSSSSYGM